jgi:hypothetical protein
MKAKSTKTKNKTPNLGPLTEFASNLLLIKHSGLRAALDLLKKVQDKNGKLTDAAAKAVTDYFKTIYKYGQADGADVAAALLANDCFITLVVQTQKNRRTLVKVKSFLDKTGCYDPMDPTHPNNRQAYFIFSLLSGIK